MGRRRHRGESVPSFLTEDQPYLDKVGDTGFKRIPPMRGRVPIRGTGAEHLVQQKFAETHTVLEEFPVR